MTPDRRTGSMHERIVALAVGQPKRVMIGALLLLVALGSQLPRVQIDTDPENMLPADQGARVQHDEVKRFVYSSPDCYRCHPSGRGD